jgi:hypothetical protein
MAFSGNKPVVESVLHDVSGSALALVHSSSLDITTQPGMALVGAHSGSNGWSARILEVDEEGRLKVDAQIVPAGVQTVTGTVVVSDGGGSLTIDGAVTANVTGSVGLDRGDSTSNPLFVTGSFSANLSRGDSTVNPLFVTGSVGIGGPVNVVGTVTSQVTGTVNLDRGNDVTAPIWATGSVGIVGTVRVEPAIHTSASGTFFTATTSTLTIAPSDVSRRGLVIYNDSNKAMYVKFGAGASTTDYTYKVFSDDGWTMPDFLYSGVITAIWSSGGSGNISGGAMVTQVT